MMSDTRGTVRHLDRQRMAKRAALLKHLARAKVDLLPRNIASRWTARQMGALKVQADQAKGVLRKNTPTLVVAAVALLLFSARRPIFDFISRFGEKRDQDKDGSA